MATPHQDTATPSTTTRTVPVGRKDTRSMNTVLLYGVAAFAIFAVLFIIIDVLNGHF